MQCLWCGPLRWTKKFTLDGAGNPAVTQENLGRPPFCRQPGAQERPQEEWGRGRGEAAGRAPASGAGPLRPASREQRPGLSTGLSHFSSSARALPSRPGPAPSHPGLPAAPRGPSLVPGGSAERAGAVGAGLPRPLSSSGSSGREPGAGGRDPRLWASHFGPQFPHPQTGEIPFWRPSERAPPQSKENSEPRTLPV
ncbi:hypothetical protein J1605_020919 [Eschrichtius robustus]|uniref:Uncharacterized protein n=1 Tax=Eschrichtius robustus TaxID=9764 RepID=A0AB34HIJ7_ESCRO|nr:hypothetical protein J1605_020919 [Eschrichtius robustus]